MWHLLIEGGHIYVCGDAQFMAPAVEASLLRIIQTYVLPEIATSYLEKLAEQGRYQRDVWF